MDLVTLGVVSQLGEAFFNAAVDSVGQATFSHLKYRVSTRWINNHDVAKTLHESYVASLTILEKQHAKTPLDRPTRDTAAQAFSRLRKLSDQYFPLKGEGASVFSDADMADLLSNQAAAQPMQEALLRAAEPMPPSMRNLLAASFLTSFLYAFKELGLKQNDKVRAVILHEMMTDLRESARIADVKLDNLQQDLSRLLPSLEKLDALREFQRQFQDSITDSLKSISSGVAEIASGQRELKEMLAKLAEAKQGEGPVKAYLLVYDQDGQPLARHPVGTSLVTIGRVKENKIQLPHSAVSGRHAELHAEGKYFVLRDVGSTNGTLVGDDPQRIRQAVINFGQVFRIGPYRIELQTPDQGEAPFFPRTVMHMEDPRKTTRGD
ncbi:MAG: FHA domain-containing protein [Planctomycetes bacterium]|nr:FHA domain-containing protein [Planctomycetota bacterium]